MRSKRSCAEGQHSLWEQVPDEGGTSQVTGPVPRPSGGARGSVRASAQRTVRSRERAVATAADAGGWQPGDRTWVLCDEAFVSQGWAAGTVLHLSETRRAVRGDLVVVEDRGRTGVGFLGTDRGRPALLTDRGTTWLSQSARVLAAVTAVEASLLLGEVSSVRDG